MSLRQAIFSTFKEIFQTALISLGIFFFVYIFLVQPHRVKGDSMVPNFADGELILTEKISYRFFKPERGDVIVFKSPTAKNADFIKRIIALPGENVKIENGSISVNGQKLTEDYIKVPTEGNFSRIVSSNEYFVLGDNRHSSFDSRVFGNIKKETILGKAWLVYWPILESKKSEGIRLVSRAHYSISNSFDNR